MQRIGWTTEEHRAKATGLASQASNLLAQGELEAVSGLVDQAFEVVEHHGCEEDAVFLSVLLVAGDLSFACEEYESAAALYRRLVDVGGPMDDGTATDLVQLLARGWLGLARCDAARVGLYAPRAAERYSETQNLLARVPGGTPEAIVEEIDAALQRP